MRKSLWYFQAGELVTLARRARLDGDSGLSKEILDHLSDRMRRSAHRGHSTGYREEMIAVAANCDAVDPRKVMEYIAAHKEAGLSLNLLEVHASELRRAKRLDIFRKILTGDFEEKENQLLVREAALLAMELGVDTTLLQKLGSVKEPVMAVLFALVPCEEISCDGVDLPHLVMYGKRLRDIYGYGSAIRKGIAKDLHSTFFSLWANHLWGVSDKNETWLKSIGTYAYDARFLRELDEIARELVGTVKSGIVPGIGFVFERLRDFEKPTPNSAAESWDVVEGIKRAMTRIALDLLCLGGLKGVRPQISAYEIDLAFDGGFCNWGIWTEEYLPRGRTWMNKRAAKALLDRTEPLLKNRIDTFPDRAEMFSEMAILAATHGLDQDAARYVEQTASNLLGYGYRKDVLLFAALDSVLACHNAGAIRAKDHVCRLAPAIAQVTEFTDGAMTYRLPFELADTLARMDRDLLMKYYKWLLREEQYSVADHAFGSYLKVCDLSSDVSKRVAGTALDTDSIKILQERHTQGDPDVPTVLAEIAAYLGELPRFPEDVPPTHTPMPDNHRDSGARTTSIGLSARAFHGLFERAMESKRPNPLASLAN